MMRTSAEPSAAISLVRQSVAAVDRSIAVRFRTLSRQLDDSLVSERLLAILSCFFGGLALLLASIGLYGAISFAVTERRTELGVRMALGAPRGSILRLVLRDVAVILVAGVAMGTVISLLLVQLVQNLLFGLAARDTLTLVLAVTALSIVALLAGLLPGRRATRINPIIALRHG